MPRSTLTGSRIRDRRMIRGIKQADLARAAGISPSYLNLIEHNKRRIAGKVLSDLARALEADVATLTEGAGSALLDQLGEAAAGLPEVEAETARVDELVSRFPGWSAMIVAQQRRIADLDRQLAGVADRLAHDPFLPASLHELLSRVSAIQSTAAILEETEDLDANWQRRFQRNLHTDARKLAEGAALLVDHLERESDLQTGSLGPQEEVEAWLDQVDWHVPQLEHPDPASPERLAASAALSDAGRIRLGRFLEHCRQDAIHLPLADFSAAAIAAAYDPVHLARQFSVDVAMVLRRLATLPGHPGLGRIGYVSADAAGALTLRKGTDQLQPPRIGSACALWPLFQAMSRPGVTIRVQMAHAARPREAFVGFAIAQPSLPRGVSGPLVMEAAMVFLPPGMLEPDPSFGPVETVGTSCRVCPAAACPARREPSALADGFDTERQKRNSRD